MFATLPLLLLAVAVILVAAMPWRRTHPNHLFFLEHHLQEEAKPKSEPPSRRNLGTGPRLREAADRQQLKRALAVRGHSGVVSTTQGRRTSGRCVVLHDAAGMSRDLRNQAYRVDVSTYLA
jgi:hypothetical protein